MPDTLSEGSAGISKERQNSPNGGVQVDEDRKPTDGIGQFIDGLYSRFFLRDLLSYIVPGSVTLAVLAVSYDVNSQMLICQPLVTHFPGLFLGILAAISYVFGAGMLGFCHVLKIFRYSSDSSEESLNRMVAFQQAGASSEIHTQRERYLVLKQLYAVNALAWSLGVACLLVQFHWPKTRGWIAWVPLVVSICGLCADARSPMRLQETLEKVVTDKQNPK
jgi:hypothetical protein